MSKKSKREKYIEDEEYKEVYDRATIFIKMCMEISYCCAARIDDVLNIKMSDLKEEGIFIVQGKTGKKQIKRWTPRLRAAIALASQLPKYKRYKDIESFYLIHNMRCDRYTYNGFSKVWQATKKGADYIFHDIKAKSISDYDGDKGKFSGNKKTVHIYDRKTEVVDSLDYPENASVLK